MDIGGQTLTGATKEIHPGTEIADELLELDLPQDDMDQLCEGTVITPAKRPLRATSGIGQTRCIPR